VSDLTPARVMARLHEIDEDLAERQNELEESAEQLKRAQRAWEYQSALLYPNTTGTVAERESAVLVALVAAQPALYEQLCDSEAKYAAIQKVVDLLGKRASIGQSILKAQTREFSAPAPRPAWSGS
jgi:hypothetical protein